jgi:hypothetical protein
MTPEVLAVDDSRTMATAVFLVKCRRGAGFFATRHQDFHSDGSTSEITTGFVR